MPPATGNQIVVGVGDVAVTTDPTAIFITYALGSCLGVAVYDPTAKVGGLLHFMLPDSHLNPEKAREKPAMFGDTGLPLLLNELLKMGASKKGLIIKVAGGANVLSDGQFFDIGNRNILMAKRLLWKNALLIKGEDTAGTISRTMTLEMATGRVIVRNTSMEKEL